MTSSSDRKTMVRKDFGTKGQKIELLSNYVTVEVDNLHGHFYNYSVNLIDTDGNPAAGKGKRRQILDKVHEIYSSDDLGGKVFAYDGGSTLYTYGALPNIKSYFIVVLDLFRTSASANELADRKRLRCETFYVEISYARKISIKSIAAAMCGRESKDSQELIRILNIILRQRAATQGCWLLRPSYFHSNPRNCVAIGGDLWACSGFHTSFRTTQGGLSLNMDVATTTVIKPGPVIGFLLANQKTEDLFSLDWSQAKKTLKNLRIKVNLSNEEYRITGLSENTCRQQT